MSISSRPILIGISFAVLATLIWSGNFIIAREAIHSIPPVTLAFYRWLTATIIILPFALQDLPVALIILNKNRIYFLVTAITGITMFNTFVYIAGHYSPAINMALIGTTTSPIISVSLAAIFLNEKITPIRITGMLICLAGILLLLSNGSIERLLSFSFTRGDWWILAAALSFAIYNTMVKKKPREMNSIHLLFICFLIGTILLGPFYFFELMNKGGFQLTFKTISFILYLGIGTSVIAFLLWNAAILRLGAGRTALFGNLIPVFSAIEAVLLLNEEVTWVHFGSFILVIVGLMIANMRLNKKESKTAEMD